MRRWVIVFIAVCVLVGLILPLPAEASHTADQVGQKMGTDLYHLQQWFYSPIGWGVVYFLTFLFTRLIIHLFEEVASPQEYPVGYRGGRRPAIFKDEDMWPASVLWPLTLPLILCAVLFRTVRTIKSVRYAFPLRTWFRSADEYMHKEEREALARLGGPSERGD